MIAAAPAILEISDLTVSFVPTGRAAVKVVDGVDLAIAPGETFAIVGESGSGKSTTGLAIMGLLDRTATVAGAIRIRDERGAVTDLLGLRPAGLRAVRGGTVAMVFQEPLTSLNPVQSVGAQIGEALRLDRRLDPAAVRTRVLEAIAEVGIPDPERRVRAYPHELSGGMRQRVLIAMALARRPRLLIADEPATALDVTVQAQILELLKDIQRARGMALLFVTHNLAVVAEIADRVGVMYAGRLVETARTAELFASPRHPYTRALLNSLPGASASHGGGPRRLRTLPGTVGDPRSPPPGCAFEPRCALAQPPCRRALPPMAVLTASRASRCVRWREL